MSEQCPDILRCDPQNLRQAMSIHTRKITDACRDKDCVEDLRVYLTAGSQQTLDNAANVRVRSAQLLHTYIDVEPVAFDRNHYCIDITFYYRILADAVVGTCRPAALSGLAVFSKRAVLCGEDSRAHIFTSDTRIGEAEVKDACECGTAESVTVQIPAGIRALFDEELTIPGDHRRLYVTLGQFSIVRLERDVQLVVPMVEYAIPEKECCDSEGCCTEDPCEMFSRIPFPARQFTPTGCDRKKETPCDQD